VLAVVTVLVVAALVWAAPIVQKFPAISDEFLTLAQIDKVQLKVLMLDPAMAKAGIKPEDIYDDWKGHLKAADITVVEGDAAEDMITIRLMFVLRKHEQVTDATTYLGLLMLEQPVRIERLDRTFVIPTYTGVEAGLTPNNKIADSTRKALTTLISKFLKRTRESNLHF